MASPVSELSHQPEPSLFVYGVLNASLVCRYTEDGPNGSWADVDLAHCIAEGETKVLEACKNADVEFGTSLELEWQRLSKAQLD